MINMSYGSPSRCIAEEQQIQRAVKAGAIPVAASGNEFDAGQPARVPGEPAARADGRRDRARRQADVLLQRERRRRPRARRASGSSPPCPVALRPRRQRRRLRRASPARRSRRRWSSAAVAWVRAARPELTPFQAAQVVRLGARDVGEPGYENATGFGVLSLPGALARQPPADDPLEPNDDIRYVNGRAFGDAGAAALQRPAAARSPRRPTSPRTRSTSTASRSAPGASCACALVPSVGDPDLFVFGGKARSVRATRSIAALDPRGRQQDRRGHGAQPRPQDDDVLRRRRLPAAASASSCSTRATRCAPAEPRGAR